MKATVINQVSKETRKQLTNALSAAINELQGEGGLAELVGKNLEGMEWLFNLHMMAEYQFIQDLKEEMKQNEKDEQAAIRDCRNGIYDKWYRYHREHDGRAYDRAWQKENEQVQNEKVTFLEA